MTDNVNHPKHYRSHPSGVECITVTEHMSFNLGNATKYIWRAGLKSDNPLEDLKKAAWYIQRELERLSPTLEDYVAEVDAGAERAAAETKTPPQYSKREPRKWRCLREVPIICTVTDKYGLLWRHFAVDGWLSNPDGPAFSQTYDTYAVDLRGPYTEVL